MRKKARAKRASSRGTNANGNIKARENALLMGIKQIERPSKTPTGKGLGKAGAKRLGRLLKRAIQVQEFTRKGKAPLPKTPVRLFKHQIQFEAESAPNKNTATPTSLHVSQLILGVVSQCKHRGGISMAELKKTLAAGGYDVTKNSRQMNVVTQRLVNTETLVRTTRNATFRLNKKQTDTKEIRMTRVKSKPQPKADLQQSKTARKSIKGEEKPRRRARQTPKPKGKSPKPRGKTRERATRKTHKAKRKSPKPAGKKYRSATKQGAWVRRAPRKARRTLRRRPKQTRHPYKSPWKRQTQKRRLPKTRPRLKTQRRRVARRRVYYYYY